MVITTNESYKMNVYSFTLYNTQFFPWYCPELRMVMVKFIMFLVPEVRFRIQINLGGNNF